MQVLVPIPVTDANYSSSTIAAEDPGTVWAPGTFAVGDLRWRVETHRIYKRITAGTDAGGQYPELNPSLWLNYAPTNRWAIFDGAVSTQTVATTSMSYTIQAGFFNAIAFFGLAGANSLTVTVQNGLGGPTVYTYTTNLDETQPGDWYDYFFGGFRTAVDIVIPNIIPYANAYVTFTISGAATVKCGMVAFGDLRPIGLSQYGAKGSYQDYSYIGIDANTGANTIMKRSNAKNMALTSEIAISEANTVQRTLRDLLGVPAVYVGSSETDYEALRVFGLGSGEVSFDGPRHCMVNITVKGLI
jgi:hypothetical protein